MSERRAPYTTKKPKRVDRFRKQASFLGFEIFDGDQLIAETDSEESALKIVHALNHVDKCTVVARRHQDGYKSWLD